MVIDTLTFWQTDIHNHCYSHFTKSKGQDEIFHAPQGYTSGPEQSGGDQGAKSIHVNLYFEMFWNIQRTDELRTPKAIWIYQVIPKHCFSTPLLFRTLLLRSLFYCCCCCSSNYLLIYLKCLEFYWNIRKIHPIHSKYAVYLKERELCYWLFVSSLSLSSSIPKQKNMLRRRNQPPLPTDTTINCLG